MIDFERFWMYTMITKSKMSKNKDKKTRRKEERKKGRKEERKKGEKQYDIYGDI